MTGISAGNTIPDILTLPYTSAHPPDLADQHQHQHHHNHSHNHPSSAVPPPVASISKGNRRSLAGLALEKTSNVIASLASLGTTSNPALRTSASHGTLSKQAHKYAQIGGVDRQSNNEISTVSEDISTPSLYKSPTPGLSRRNTVRLIPQEVLNLDNTAASRANKMHQTSSRLLRMTEDERPFTKV